MGKEYLQAHGSQEVEDAFGLGVIHSSRTILWMPDPQTHILDIIEIPKNGILVVWLIFISGAIELTTFPLLWLLAKCLARIPAS